MAQGVIYTVEGDGLRRMLPSAPETEDRMQALVARYPELITDGDGDLLLVAREPAIAETLTSIRRAGADIVLTYWAQEWAERYHRGITR